MPPDTIPKEFVSLYESERARTLRTRAIWYCAIAVGYLLLKLPRGIMGALASERFIGPWAQVVSDAAILLLHAGTLVYLAWRARTRESLVHVMSWVIVGACIIAIIATPLSDNTNLIKDALPVSEPRAAFLQGIATLVAVFFIHFVSTWLVNLSPKEGLELILPILAVFAGVTLFITDTTFVLKLTLIGMAPLAGLPGFVWSWWLHRSFNERFMAREASRRYHDVTRELTDARTVHEALFPRPITTGPVRVEYRYEPAQQIGGDFVFIHPAFPAPTPLSDAGVPQRLTTLSDLPEQEAPAASECGALEGIRPISIVLIDVTGHGFTAALAVNRLFGELERTFALAPESRPGQVLATLNHFTGALLATKGIYATAICMRAEPVVEAGVVVGVELRWANAGHPAALLLPRAGFARRLDATAPILGMLDPPVFDPGELRVRLAPGDSILAYSDGAIELEGEGGELLGVEGFTRMVEACRRSEAAGEGLCDRLMREIEPLRTRSGKRDDTLLVRVTAAEGVATV
ncbi:MAG: SpoIIE family protein phosphatase [Phycisphaeraceae bacterium]|nr:SpoIIE family protein phosphatase [Phycisphaeraceae bacterium]